MIFYVYCVAAHVFWKTGAL